MAANTGGEVLFDVPMEIDRPLSELWDEGESYGPLSSRKDMRRAGNLLLRQHYLHAFEYMEGEMLEEAVDTAERHFNQLQAFGMSIVSHVTEPHADLPADLENMDDDEIVAISASAYVASTRPLHKPYASKHLPQLKVRQLVVDPLKRYLDWLQSSRQEAMLSDVFTSNQYGWHMGSGTVFLYDIDPHLTPLDPNVQHADPIEMALEDLTEPDGLDNLGI